MSYYETSYRRQTKPPAALQGDEADLYRQLQPRLINALRRTFPSPDDTLHEEAAAHAWMQLLLSQPRRETAFQWLVTVALNYARKDLRDHPAPRELDARAADTAVDPVTPELAFHARQALDRLSRLPDRQQRYLTLQAAGHSRTDIAHRTGTTIRTVDRHLGRARRTLKPHDPDL